MRESMCKKSTQIHWKFMETYSEAPTTSSHMPPHPPPPSMWKEVAGASLWISEDFQWIWVDFLHVDSNFLNKFGHFFQKNLTFWYRLHFLN